MSGEFKQSVINLRNALLYSWNQQLQAWHMGLEMKSNVFVRFNIQFLQRWKHTQSIEHYANYISGIIIDLWNKMMKAMLR